MNFADSVKHLESGKKIRRKSWPKLKYLKMDEEEVIAYQGEYSHFEKDPKLLISTGWKIVDGDDTSFSFVEAVEHLRNKKCLTRDDMGEAFIFIDSNQITFCQPVEFVFMPSWECLNANDWETVK